MRKLIVLNGICIAFFLVLPPPTPLLPLVVVLRIYIHVISLSSASVALYADLRTSSLEKLLNL